MNTNLDDFAQKLLEEKGLSYLHESVLTEMKQDILNRIENRIFTIIASNIPDEHRSKFEEFVASDASNEEIQNYCAELIPNLQSLIAADLVQFKTVYLGVSNNA